MPSASQSSFIGDAATIFNSVVIRQTWPFPQRSWLKDNLSILSKAASILKTIICSLKKEFLVQRMDDKILYINKLPLFIKLYRQPHLTVDAGAFGNL